MRTTLTIDDDILRIAKNLAQESSQSVGRILSNLARKGLKSGELSFNESGIPVFSVSEDAPLFGPDEVSRGEDDL